MIPIYSNVATEHCLFSHVVVGVHFLNLAQIYDYFSSFW